MPQTEMTGHWSCPLCQFAFSPTAAVIALGYCPRCVARRHVEECRGDTDAELARRFDLVFDDYRSGRVRSPMAGRFGVPSS